jgi:diketogulonate reductase-like aldo/keto reductase
MTGAAMEHVTLGGVRMPILGFGTWELTGDRAYEAVRRALATGYRHIDTATMYANEEEVGLAVRDSGLRREEVFLTTKLLPEHASRARAALDTSLRALATDHVDLWLIHWPPAGRGVNAWRELLAVRDEGLTRAVGVSNFSITEIDELIDATGDAPAVNQIRWAPSLYDPGLLTEHHERGVAVEGYSPFKSTDLHHPVLVEIASGHGVTPAQVVLRWHIEHRIVVIPKSATPERITSNLDIFGFALSADEVARIDAVSGG